MRLACSVCIVALTACATIVTRPGGRRSPDADKHDAAGSIVLDGVEMPVRWSDGDSFDFLTGPRQGQESRLRGYNALESYGPVHRWGDWTREELFTLSKQASTIAASQIWKCTSNNEEDAYHRLLIECPELRLEMVKTGYGLAYEVKGRPERPVLEAMMQAQRAKRGVWAKGVPKTIITSLHSRDEDTDGKYKTSANRILNTENGEAPLHKHMDNYRVCQEVCIGDSCMVYVPYEMRYKDPPPCISGE